MADSGGAEEIGAEEPLLGGGRNKGGIRTLPFIIGNEAIESCVSTGLSSNFTPYLMGEYGMSAVRTSNLLYLRSTLGGITPVLGAFLADSYVGRFRTIAFGAVFTSLGMALLWVTSAIPQARPYCDKSLSHCDSPTAFHLFVLYSSFVLMCIGGGGIKASSLAFGGDQLATNKNKRILESFIGWYYVFTLVGSLFGMTVIVYIQDNISWNLGFGIPAALMLLSLVSFFLVSPFFIKVEPSSSLFISLFQVVVAAYRNRHVRLPSETSHALYHHGMRPLDKSRLTN